MDGKCENNFFNISIYVSLCFIIKLYVPSQGMKYALLIFKSFITEYIVNKSFYIFELY